MKPYVLFRSLPSLALVLSFVLTIAYAAAQTETRPRLDVPFVPTPTEVVDRMLALVEIKKGDFVMDLGSGDGRIAIAAVKRGADRALGVDIDPDRIREATENAKKEGVSDKVTFRQADLFKTEIKDANVITMYLLTSVNLRLRPRLLDELRPGTRIVSHQFDLGEWEADQHEKIGHRDVYMWTVPAKVEGNWEVTDGSSKFTINLKQNFQKIEGRATIGERTTPLIGPRLQGERIDFTVNSTAGSKQFTGKVVGDRIEGEKGWTAKRSS